jgi:hypothetical protein
MIKIRQETDVVALSAFLLAAFAAVAQVVAWSRGPRISFLGPDRVALYSDLAPNGQPIIRVAAPLAYANTANPEYAAILFRETVVLTVGQIRTEQVWNAFGMLGRANGRLTVTSNGLAAIQTLSGQSATSHLTLFAPLIRECRPGPACSPNVDYVSPEAFLRAIHPGDRVHLHFEGAFFREKTQTYDCDAVMTQDTLQQWSANGSAYVRCHESAATA